MILTLNLESNNAAFSGDDGYGDADFETGRILRDIAYLIETGYTSGYPTDYNGNRVGYWEYSAAK